MSRLTRAAICAGFACGVGLAIAPAAGAATEACNPTPKVDTSFCVTYGAAVSTNQAAAPFSTDLTLADTSTNHSGDENRWLDHGIVDFYSGGGTGPPILTPSAQLPDHLLIAGGGPCTAPDFTDCGGGHGGVLGAISGNAFANGTFGGTFGVSKVVNVNPPPAGDAVKWILTFHYCLNGFCGFPPQDVPLEVPASGSGTADPALTLLLRQQIPIPIAAGGGTADVSLDTASLHWDSQSDQIDGGGTLSQPAVIARMPLRCGTDNGTASVFDVAGSSVSIGQSFSVTGCPTARFSAAPDGLAVDLDGSASSTPVAGRTVKKWMWNFGDGSTKTTTVPTVSHTYTTYGDHTVKLRVADSAGALSTQVSHLVRGTTTTLNVNKTATAVRASGAVSPSHAGKTMNVTLYREAGSVFQSLATKHPVLSSSSTYLTGFARPNPGTCRIKAVFPGDSDHLGSLAAKNFSC